jgi:hypothetical protein
LPQLSSTLVVVAHADELAVILGEPCGTLIPPSARASNHDDRCSDADGRCQPTLARDDVPPIRDERLIGLALLGGYARPGVQLSRVTPALASHVAWAPVILPKLTRRPWGRRCRGQQRS